MQIPRWQVLIMLFVNLWARRQQPWAVLSVGCEVGIAGIAAVGMGAITSPISATSGNMHLFYILVQTSWAGSKFLRTELRIVLLTISFPGESSYLMTSTVYAGALMDSSDGTDMLNQCFKSFARMIGCLAYTPVQVVLHLKTISSLLSLSWFVFCFDRGWMFWCEKQIAIDLGVHI